LRAAGEGFSTEGYASTGIGGIAERSGLTRGALFHHFEDKRGLAVAWIREVLALDVKEKCLSRLLGARSFAAWKQVCLDLLREVEVRHPMAQLTLLGSEWSGDEMLRAEVAAVVDLWVGGMTNVLERGQLEGWIHRSIQPADEAVLLVTQYCGMSLLVRLSDSAGALRSAERALGSYLETLRGEA
jgi:TetR/AcrR family transcriptional regulator, transcriptional repressor for nem operon